MTDFDAQPDLQPRQKLFALEGMIRSYVDNMDALGRDRAYLSLVDAILESPESHYPFVESELIKMAYEKGIKEEDLTPEGLKYAYYTYGIYLERVADTPLTSAEEEFILKKKERQYFKSVMIFMGAGFSKERAEQIAKEIRGKFPYKTFCKVASATELALNALKPGFLGDS